MAVAFGIVLPGTLGSYSDLVTKVALWLDRDDLTNRIPDFIALAEARFNRLLRVPQMETGRVRIETTEKVSLPDDFLQARTIYLEGSPDRPLRAMSPSAIARDFSGASGIPQAYAIAGREIRLAPPPNDSVTVSLDYYARIPPLSSSIPSNWLLDENCDLYAYATMLEASVFIRDNDAVSYYGGRVDQILAEIIGAGNRARWGGGPLVPNSVAQVRGARC